MKSKDHYLIAEAYQKLLKEEIESSATLYLLIWSEPYECEVIYGIYDSKESAGQALLHVLKEEPDNKNKMKVVTVPLNPLEPVYSYTSSGKEVDMSYEGWDLDKETKDSFRGIANQL